MAPVFFKRYWKDDEEIGKYNELYGFVIDQSKSNPSEMITYIEDNKDYIPAKMNFDTKVFDYGNWANAFFMKVRPCVVSYNGTVRYYLNPNDYTKDISGNAAIIDANCPGNVMVEFPKIYWKIVDNGDNTANIYVCDGRKDRDFHCWSHLDANGNEIDYCYLSAYLGSVSSSKLVSRSGARGIATLNMASAITDAKNNYPSEEIWFVESFADMTMVNILLMLIGKSTDSQNVFGQGETRNIKNAYSSVPYRNGKLNANGIFYCNYPNVSTSSAYGDTVKVFGMEHWWGGANRRIVGFIRKSKTEALIKMTHSKKDGSTIEGFNNTGEGYINTGEFAFESDSSSGVVAEMNFSKYGMCAKNLRANSDDSYSVGYTDYRTTYSSGNLGFAHGGGVQMYNSTSITYSKSINSQCGMFYESYKPLATNIQAPNSNAWVMPETFCLTCKPLAK